MSSYGRIVIIGAPRSGTNMLRDVLTAWPGIATWPCDEINYIWRHGNIAWPDDEFTPDMASERLKRYVGKRLDWVARRYSAHTVVEKTCANSLRVGFVDRLLPDAKYIFIYRNGWDVTASAMKRWSAELDIPYLLRKARFVPMLDLPYYAARYLWSRMHRIGSPDKRLAFWGPRFKGMDEALRTGTLAEVCARQWARCVERSLDAFEGISEDRLCAVRYEDMVRSPESEMSRILGFLGLQVDAAALSSACAPVSGTSVGKGQVDLPEEQMARLRPIIDGVQARLSALAAGSSRGRR